MTSSVLTLVLVIVVALVTLLLVSIYNRLVRLRNGAENAFSAVDVQLKQRCDLVPRIVDAMREYMAHERGTFDELTALRERATAQSTSAADRVAIDQSMSTVLRGLVVRAEAYPELRASETVALLQRSLNEVEGQIAASRRTFSAAVTTYNTAIDTVPANLVAGLFGFSRKPLFEASADDRLVPDTRRS